MKFFKRLFLKQIQEADLNGESIRAAGYYLKTKLSGAPMIEKTNANNYVAHGFYMGVRWREEQLGAKKCTPIMK